MKKLSKKIGIVTGFALAAATTAFALSASPEIEIAEASLAGSELTLKFADSQDVPNVCDFAVTRMELLEPIETLVVNLKAPQPCLVERYGKRKASIKWSVPAKFRRDAKLRVLVNQSVIGSLVFTNGSVSFQKN